VRRSRIERLELVQADGTRVHLAFQERDPGELTTQDVFQVSPDGAHLAYAADNTLHVRAADGSERALTGYELHGLVRFSPDSKYLAAVLGQDEQRVVALDLATGEAHALAAFPRVRQLEWSHGGLVASVQDSGRDELVALPQRKTLFAGDIDRFVAAATGTRIVVFHRNGAATQVLAFDAATPAVTHELAVVLDPITNAAASLDGGHVAFTTAVALFTATGDARADAISDRGNIHSLWFAHDGRLGYASPMSATILDHGHARRFDSEGQIAMLRFDPTSDSALVATPHGAWDAMTSQLIAKQEDLLGVDRFAGGLVLWTGR
jgi:hypothetical protein